jgi:hypothetical protein
MLGELRDAVALWVVAGARERANFKTRPVRRPVRRQFGAPWQGQGHSDRRRYRRRLPGNYGWSALVTLTTMLATTLALMTRARLPS